MCPEAARSRALLLSVGLILAGACGKGYSAGPSGFEDLADAGASSDAGAFISSDAGAADAGYQGDGAAGDGGVTDGGLQAWSNVTPPGISLDPSQSGGENHGVVEMLADPAHPGTVYAGTDYQGIWKSADYGQTWAKVSHAGSAIDGGRNWGMGISHDGKTLYTFAGYGAGGLWMSTDGGATWTQRWTDPLGGSAGNDLYMIDVDPANDQHLLLTLHGNAPDASYDNHVFVSSNGGATWQDAGGPGITNSAYVFFITSTTWIAVSQWTSNVNGTWRTADAGAHWSQILDVEHGHGNDQVAVLPNGTVYLPGIGKSGGGVWRSNDFGATWTRVLSTNAEATVVATADNLYASYGWATSDTNAPSLFHAARETDQEWTRDAAPPAMTNGAKRAAVLFDGTHYVVVMGCFDAGIWRYVEP
jgi:hypothetical protein